MSKNSTKSTIFRRCWLKNTSLILVILQGSSNSWWCHFSWLVELDPRGGVPWDPAEWWPLMFGSFTCFFCSWMMFMFFIYIPKVSDSEYVWLLLDVSDGFQSFKILHTKVLGVCHLFCFNVRLQMCQDNKSVTWLPKLYAILHETKVMNHVIPGYYTFLVFWSELWCFIDNLKEGVCTSLGDREMLFVVMISLDSRIGRIEITVNSVPVCELNWYSQV